MRVQAGWAEEGDTRRPVMKEVEDRFTDQCNYSRGIHEKGRQDPTCGDCIWKHKQEAACLGD